MAINKPMTLSDTQRRVLGAMRDGWKLVYALGSGDKLMLVKRKETPRQIELNDYAFLHENSYIEKEAPDPKAVTITSLIISVFTITPLGIEALGK